MQNEKESVVRLRSPVTLQHLNPPSAAVPRIIIMKGTLIKGRFFLPLVALGTPVLTTLEYSPKQQSCRIQNISRQNK